MSIQHGEGKEEERKQLMRKVKLWALKERELENVIWWREVAPLFGLIAILWFLFVFAIGIMNHKAASERIDEILGPANKTLNGLLFNEIAFVQIQMAIFQSVMMTMLLVHFWPDVTNSEFAKRLRDHMQQFGMEEKGSATEIFDAAFVDFRWGTGGHRLGKQVLTN